MKKNHNFQKNSRQKFKIMETKFRHWVELEITWFKNNHEMLSKKYFTILENFHFLKKYIIAHRGEAALRINCDTLDTFRTKECKEIIETAKINIIQQKCKISETFAIFKIYRLCRISEWRKWNHENTTNSRQIGTQR